jgi:cytidylate kinase
LAIIVLTRGSLSAAFRLADALCLDDARIKISREEVIKNAEKYGVAETGMAETGYMELQPPQFWDRNSAQRKQYLLCLKASLMEFIVRDNVVYHGHLAQFLLSDVPKLLRVRVDASGEYRINAILKESDITPAEARKHIAEIDFRRTRWAKFLYGLDFNDPLNYDLVLNLDKMSIETMANIINCAVKSKEYDIDIDSKNMIRNIYLKSVIMAYLAGSFHLKGIEMMVECEADSGKVKIRGLGPVVGADEWKEKIEEVVMKIDGVKEIDICC